jgi:aminopeptidase N
MRRWLNLLILLAIFSHHAQGQETDPAIDVQFYHYSIELNDQNDSIVGDARIEFLLQQPAERIGLDLQGETADGKGMRVVSVREKGAELTYSQSGAKLWVSLPAKTKVGAACEVEVLYRGIPDDGLIISTSLFGQRTFFADNWPDRAHHWIPCKDYPSDKAAVEFSVIAPDHYQIISNGLQVEESNLPDHRKLTRYLETVPLPTKVMVIGAADFAVGLAGEVGCIPVTSWVYPQNRDAGFYDYAPATQILSFYIHQIGPYAYRKLANVQSKTRFGGMENASAIFYNEHSVLGDRRAEALLAHEIAHQWFGNSATETSFRHLWLSEGFATFMTHIYLASVYGIDTLIKGLREDRARVIEFSRQRKTPVVDTTAGKNFMDLLNANSYQKGGWILHMLQHQLGDSLFWKGIRKYYQTYAGHNASTNDFRDIMEAASGQDLHVFFRQWLYRAGQPNLQIQWHYQSSRKELMLQVVQRQDQAFDFPLTMKITGPDGRSRISVFPISDKNNSFSIPMSQRPILVLADPGVDLLFEGQVSETP